MAASVENILPEGHILSSGVGAYRIEKKLGSGGFGITYLTVSEVKVGNVTADMHFAVKEHFPSAYCRRGADGSVVPLEGHDDDFRRSATDFEAETRRLQKYGTDCDNIVKVNEVFEANGTVYYVMQYISGESLDDYVRSRGTLTPAEAKNILGPVLDAVTYLHSHRVNHLDIKPENIMLQKKGDAVTPVLIDFGLSVHFRKSGGKTSPKGVMGVTDGFAPLEQYAGIQEFNPTTDVYALAATFLYCLTGRIPAKASELRLQDVRKAVGDKLGEEELEGLCRALCKSSDDRTQSVARLKVDLGIVTSGGNGTVEIRKGDDSRPNWLKWALIGGLVVGAAAVIWFVAGNRGDDSRQEKGDAVSEKTEIADSAVVESPAEVAGQIVVTQEYIDSLAHAKDDSIRRAEAASTAPATQSPQSTPTSSTTPTTPTPAKPNVTSGTLTFGYATWSGGIRDGKPHGSGRLTFHSSHAVDRHSSVQASPGDYFNATYENGQLISGKLYDSAGNLLKTIIP